MKNQAIQIQKFILEHVDKYPKSIVATTAEQFGVSRTTVHRHLQKLIKENKIIKTGTTREVHYCLTSSQKKTFTFEIAEGLDEFNIFKKYISKNLFKVPENIYSICEYGFTEVFNNAIDHSLGTKITVKTEWEFDKFTVRVIDNGIGIFKKISNALNLSDIRESVLQLTKGKLTTDPLNHTGEGIFFSSRVFDLFCIEANQLCFCKDNLENDWYLNWERENAMQGTAVTMQIHKDSKRDIVEVFKEYQNTETLAFDRTTILVELVKLGDERYISRSQAKRILYGLEKFKHIKLDFKGVITVGQGFLDEIFRVYKNKHPGITINYINANENVEFMIKRTSKNI